VDNLSVLKATFEEQVALAAAAPAGAPQVTSVVAFRCAGAQRGEGRQAVQKAKWN
jgi:hypothetical protein